MSHIYQNYYFMNTIRSYFLDIGVSLPRSVLQIKDKPVPFQLVVNDGV